MFTEAKVHLLPDLRAHTAGLREGITEVLSRIGRVAINLVTLVVALQWVRLEVDRGTIVIEHLCGSQVRIRADGNLDAYSVRNILTQTRGVMHLNPERHSDDLYTNYEDLKHAFPERFDDRMEPPLRPTIRGNSVFCDGEDRS